MGLDGGSLNDLEQKHFKEKVLFWKEILVRASDWKWCGDRDISRHLKNVHAAVLTVGGWFDAEDLSGALKIYRANERNNPGTTNTLVMGPWSHGLWNGGDADSLGHMKFHNKTGEFFREKIELPFFRRFLKGDTNVVAMPEAYVFETGKAEWRMESAWPPTNAVPKSLFFHARGRLSFDPPKEGENAFDEYVSDPAHPVPFTQRISTDMPAEYMWEDQRFASTRPDVLVFQTEPQTPLCQGIIR